VKDSWHACRSYPRSTKGLSVPDKLGVVVKVAAGEADVLLPVYQSPVNLKKSKVDKFAKTVQFHRAMSFMTADSWRGED
jgi:hypothetical protein